MAFCGKCGTQLSEGAKFCPKCGSPSNYRVNLCPKCGNQLSDGAKFCPKCGNKNNLVKLDNENDKNENDNKSKMKPNISIILGTAFILGLFFCLSYCSSSSENSSSYNNNESSIVDVDSISEYVEDTNTHSTNNSNYQNEGTSDYSSGASTSSSISFMGADNVIGFLANHTFTDGSGLDIRFDGDGRIYIDNDCAGVVSVLKYNSKSALLRYGGGPYGEGKIAVTIEDDGRMRLTDPVDGSTWYQKR